ncbi:MAG: hypothetical protein RLZZ519_2897 [Bacteroidota bacterium]|jgi:hypothetical protein
MRGVKFLLFVWLMLPSLAFTKAKIDQDSLLSKILELYPRELSLENGEEEEEEEAKWGRKISDDEDLYYPESVEVLPLDQDTTCFVVMVTWGPEYTRGLVTDFYEFERMETTLRLISSEGGGGFEYGGGTQRFGEPELSDSLWTLGEGIVGFAVELGSGHMASESENNILYLFALMDNEIKQVLELTLESGFYDLDLESQESYDPTVIREVLQNIDEYVPKEYHRDCICETKSRVSMGKGSTLGLRDLVIERTEYKLTPKRIVKSIKKETWRWDWYQYASGEKETY